MKIAMYFSGRIETTIYEKIKEHLNKLKERYDIKFFCSLNKDNEDEYTKIFCRDFMINDTCKNIEKTITPNEIYNLKKKDETVYDNTYSMFYHNKKCIDLIDNYEKNNLIKFDVIVKYRADIISDEIMNIEIPLENTIYIPKDHDWGGINDQIAYGDKKTMEKYSDCVNNIINYCNSNIIYHPETLLLHHINTLNLEIIRYGYKYVLRKKELIFVRMKFL